MGIISPASSQQGCQQVDHEVCQILIWGDPGQALFTLAPKWYLRPSVWLIGIHRL